MPELVACPSCGCRIQVGEFQLGRRTRCLACNQTFLAETRTSVTPAGLPPLVPSLPVLTPPRPPTEQKGMPPGRLPLCPSCHHSVPWEALACPCCGHLFDPRDGEQQCDLPPRRDSEHHRGGLIDTLGTVSLLAGAFSLCLAPLCGPLALATGLSAWILAHRDLEHMRTGLVDPSGRTSTEFGRNKALVGMVLAVLFSVFFAIFVFVDAWW